jgi:hypothetical protein
MGIYYHVLPTIPSKAGNGLSPVWRKYLEPGDRVFGGPPRRQTAATICFPPFHPFPSSLFTLKTSQHGTFTTVNKTGRVYYKLILEDHRWLF